jgi:serine/threonine protein kinase
MTKNRQYNGFDNDSDDERKSLLSAPPQSSSPELQDGRAIANTNTISCTSPPLSLSLPPPSPVFTIDEIVELIMKTYKESELYNSTCWDSMKFMLKNMITNIHYKKNKEYMKNVVIYKHYNKHCNDENENETECKYGVFKHKYMNVMFRIDNVEDQISGEGIVSSHLLKKYNNNYKDIISLGIIIPIYCHMKMSNPQLFYSVQPFITNGITLDMWIDSIKYKSNFVEIVYDAFMQLAGILKELHDVECVHGDLKPSNILIVQQQNATNVYVFLIDFGLSGIHQKSTNASGGTLPFCAPETENTIANTNDGNDVIKRPQEFDYNWVTHNKSHDIWSLGFIFMTIFVFKDVKLFYHDYPNDFFLSTGYISPRYFRMIPHETIQNIMSEHILVEPSKRCNVSDLNKLVADLAFM